MTQTNYMTANILMADDGMEIHCWISTMDVWKMETLRYPFQYTYLGDRCTWVIHTNYQLTSKLIAVIGEQADRICAEQAEENSRRNLANR